MNELEPTIAAALSALLPPRAGVSVRAIASSEWPRTEAEHAAGQRCAIEAAARAGAVQAGLPWPVGFVGSISHSRDIAIAAAAPRDLCRSMGIDIEPAMSAGRAERVADVVASEHERRLCGSPLELTLLFSAKESLFKCLHPLVHTWFDFDDAEITGADNRRMRMALLRDLGEFHRGTDFDVRWTQAHGHVLTAVLVH